MKKIVFVLLAALVASCGTPTGAPVTTDTIITDSIPPIPFDTVMYPFDSSVEIIDTPKK
jgi:hypothetical protein